MKQLLVISFIFFSSSVLCQTGKINLSLIDQKTRSVKTAVTEILARNLASEYSSELEKVRSIFRWIADNISYRVREISRHPKKEAKIIETDTSELKPLDERVAETVLQNGIAVCDGYARLFKTLCSYAGIRAEIITGYARGSRGNRRFGSNHTWNVVLIDGKWQLMDVTWASGYVSLHGDRFIQEFDENYFMAAPEKFIEEHYPDNLQWTLMDDPPLMEEFLKSPYKQKTFAKYMIKSYSPAKGLLEVNEGDTLHFELESSDLLRDHQIYSDLFPDTSVYRTASSVLISPVTASENKTSYIYYVTSADIRWVYLLYNDDVVLRYRLQVRKEKKDMASLH